MLAAFGAAAVLDRETGLVWEKAPSTGVLTWSQAISGAQFNCANKAVGGRKGWRLPSFPELASLVDPNNQSPSLPTGHPFSNVQSASYWSAATFAGFPADAFQVNFSNGFVGIFPKSATLAFWCVRGGMNADAY